MAEQSIKIPPVVGTCRGCTRLGVDCESRYQCDGRTHPRMYLFGSQTIPLRLKPGCWRNR